MAVLANRVAVATATTGTGTLTLGAVLSAAFCTFAEAGVADGDVVSYLITEGADFEIGRGTYTASGTTLSRDTVLLSKIGGTAGTTKMTLAGAAEVRIAALVEDMANVAGFQTLTGGFRATPHDLGTVSTGTTTPDAHNGNLQRMVNGGVHTLAAPANDCEIDILITNNASAGAITFSGFQVGADTGDALTTTDGDDFVLQIKRINAIATYAIKTLQ